MGKGTAIGAVAAGVAVVGGVVLLATRRASAAERSRGPVWTSTLPARDLDALARVVTSELDNGTLAERLAIAYTTINRAVSRGVSIHQLEAPGGQWGEQGPARPFSSARRASARSKRLVEWVAAHRSGLPTDITAEQLEQEIRIADPAASDDQILEAVRFLMVNAPGEPTGGAWSFWEADVQDDFTARGILYRASGGAAKDKRPQGTHPELWRFRRYFKSAAAVRADWQQGGQRRLLTVGRIELWSAPSGTR